MGAPWTETRPCAVCGHPMRSQTAREADWPGTRPHGARGLCSTCYQAELRAEKAAEVGKEELANPRSADGPGMNYGFLGKATSVELVRWFEGEQGWDYRTVKGIHRGHSATHWRVEVLGEVVEYDRTVWEVTVP